MVAEAIAYHPAIAHYLRFVATTGESGLPETMSLNHCHCHGHGHGHLPSDIYIPLYLKKETHPNYSPFKTPQSAVIRSSVPSNTGPASTHGTSLEQMSPSQPSSPGPPSSLNSA